MHAYSERLASDCEGRPKGERTRAQIQIAACRVLDGNGPQDLTISSICEQAGVSNGTFYIYFPDRHALLDVLLTGFVEFLQEFDAGGQREPARRDNSTRRPAPMSTCSPTIAA